MRSTQKNRRPSRRILTASFLAEYCNQLLNHDSVKDAHGSYNGLQVDRSNPVGLIGAAVDSHLGVIEKAAAKDVEFLIVHHGLFWDPIAPLIGPRRRKFETILSSDMAVYSSHVPLDLHPTLGNCIILARLLGLENIEPFYKTDGQSIGFKGKWTSNRKNLTKRLTDVLGAAPHTMPFGPENPTTIGVVTGYASNFSICLKENVDTFITGESPHWTHGQALEAGLNVYYGGHYLTETFGVKALAEHLSQHFGIPWVFIDEPTGL